MSGQRARIVINCGATRSRGLARITDPSVTEETLICPGVEVNLANAQGNAAKDEWEKPA